jgi:hypothetical protein
MRAPLVWFFVFLGAPSCSRSHSADPGSGASATAASASAPATSASAATASGSAARPTANAASDPSCALVTKAEAEAILGEPLQELTVSTSGMCEYRRQADVGKLAMPLAGLKLYPGETRPIFESETQNVANIMHAARKLRADLGEDGYQFGDFQFMILQHGKAISVTHLQKLDTARFEAFARKALSRL